MTLDDETAERDVFAHKTDEFVAQWLENDLPKLKRPGFGNTHDMVQSAIRRLRAGYAARDAEVEELRAELDILRATEDGNLSAMRERAERAEATLVKAREYIEALSDSPEHPIEAHHRGVLLAILDESPTERETPADEWEYGHEYTHMDGSPYRRRVSYEVFREHAPDGHRADGSPYWNYRQLRRRKAGPWMEAVPDDRA